jgi:hypothetical protein
MKTLAILFTLFYFLNALAVAPYGFKGQNQTQTLYSNVLQFPNNQVTNLGGINALAETGNKNILSNPGFEAPLSSSLPPSWVSSIFSSALSTPIDGKYSIGFFPSAQTFTFTQTSNLYATQFADGVQGLASIRVKSDVALKVCSIQASVTSTTNCVDVVPNSKWGLYKVPFILGATNNGISIASSGAVTGNIFLDDAFVGATDISQNISACQTPDCTTEFSAFVDAAGVVTNENVDWINGNGTLSGGGNSITSLTFQTGLFSTTPNCVASAENTTGYAAIINASSSTGVSVRNFTTNTPTNTTGIFRIVCQRSGSDFTTAKQLSNGNTYSSTNADTNWASCGLTGASFTGFGSSVPTPALQCKRQGSDLLIKGTFQAGTTPTAVEARMALPTWNGVQLVSANSSIIPRVQLAGNLTINLSNTTFFGEYVLIEASVPYVTFALQSSVANADTKATGANLSGTGNFHSINARIPIEGWQNSNIIIGQFNGLESCSSTLDCTDTFSARFDAAGSLLSENVDWINGNSVLSDTSLYTITLNSGIFLTASPACTVSNISTSGTTTDTVKFNNTPNTTTIVVRTQQHSTSTYNKLAQPFQVICQKQGVDYVGKTAMAVASDQNLRTPGVTNSVVYSAYIGASGTVVSEIGNLINGNCTVASTNVFTCTFTSGIFASDPVCNLTVMGASGASRSAYIVSSPTTSGLTYLTYNTSGPTAVALNVQLTCHGVSP